MRKSSSLLLIAGVVLGAMPLHAEEPDLVAQGRYIARAADCAACHTAPDGGAAYAGGYVIGSPMGGIVSTNITPSLSHGIGRWSEAEFIRAVRQGVSPEGHLYPAMPYTAYAGISDADMHALWTYFRTVPAVDAAPKALTKLAFPFDQRGLMAGWNLLFARGVPARAEDVAPGAPGRGEYLATALAHCQTCHTPRNALMAEDGGRFLAGADLGGWHAPNITPDPVAGIGGWSEAEIVTYLRDGAVHGKSQAGGPMAEAVSLSLRHLDPADLQAIAAYLKSIPAQGASGGARPAYGVSAAAPAAAVALDPAIDHDPQAMRDGSSTEGERLYVSACASCHQPAGQGTEDQFYPALLRNRAVGAAEPDNLVMVISEGIHRETNDQVVAMPAFRDEFSPAQIAAVASYVRVRFGGQATGVTEAEVRQLQAGGPVPLLLRAMPWLLGAGLVIGLLLVAALALLLRRPKRG